MFNLNAGKSNANEFNERSKSVFDSLADLESIHNAKAKEYIDKSLDNYKPESDEPIRSGESSPKRQRASGSSTQDADVPLAICHFDFKVPAVPQPRSSPQKRRRHNEPDHLINPQKWKRYSLADVKVNFPKRNCYILYFSLISIYFYFCCCCIGVRNE